LIGGQVQKDLSVGFDINLGGTRNIAEAVRRGGVKRLVYLSTFGVYDQRCMPTHPIDEGAAKGGTRGYGNFKVAQELVLEAYAAQYQFELVMLRPANVFGFGYFLAGSSGGAKMQALLEAGLDGRCARIPSTEALANEYVYAQDVGRAVDLAALARLNGIGIYNIGTGVVTPFSQLVETVTVLLPGLTVDVEPGAPAKSKSQPLDIGLAKRHLGWVPQYGLRGALEDYLSEIKLVRAVRSSGVKL
jgi:UDP-glucose 4-epimerase